MGGAKKKTRGYSYNHVRDLCGRKEITDKQAIILRDIKRMLTIYEDEGTYEFLKLHGYGDYCQYDFNVGFRVKDRWLLPNLQYALERYNKRKQNERIDRLTNYIKTLPHIPESIYFKLVDLVQKGELLEEYEIDSYLKKISVEA